MSRVIKSQMSLLPKKKNASIRIGAPKDAQHAQQIRYVKLEGHIDLCVSVQILRGRFLCFGRPIPIFCAADSYV